MKKYVILILAVWPSVVALAQSDSVTGHRTYRFTKLGFTMSLTDAFDTTNFDQTRLEVRRGQAVLFRGEFQKIVERPKVVVLDSSAQAFLFTTWSGGAHCCFTLFMGLADSTGFRIMDSLFLADGDFKLRDLDSDGTPEVLASIDHFPYAWVSFAESDFNLALYKITSRSLVEVTQQHPEVIEKQIRGYLRIVHNMKPHVTDEEVEASLQDSEEVMMMGAPHLGPIKQELACLLFAYKSLGRETDGWAALRKEYAFKGKERYFEVLKRALSK